MVAGLTHYLILIIGALVASYALFTLLLSYFWLRLKVFKKADTQNPPFISIIIPVRNEENNIGALLADLANQHFPQANFEVLVINDNSTDRTAEIVQQAAAINNNIRLIHLPDTPTTSPKKRAIETAISTAKGDLILTTDGDCRVGTNWLHSISMHYLATGAKLISSPVTFHKAKSLFDHLQIVEFSSLIGSGASAISAGYPSMCNGANLAYEKRAFQEVGGYDGVRHIASGDDEFLMHKIAAHFPGSVHFLKNPDAIVSTEAHQSWAGFFRQRKRWASKWKHYKSKTPLILALYVFSCNFAFLLSIALLLAGQLSVSQFLWLAGLKCIPEWFFLGMILRFLKRPGSIAFIPLTQVFYSLYVCFFGLAAQSSDYEWKGRKLV